VRSGSFWANAVVHDTSVHPRNRQLNGGSDYQAGLDQARLLGHRRVGSNPLKARQPPCRGRVSRPQCFSTARFVGSSVLPTAVAVATVATIMTNVIIVAGSNFARVWVHVATSGPVVVGRVIW
jgi:hypothetical protein